VNTKGKIKQENKRRRVCLFDQNCGPQSVERNKNTKSKLEKGFWIINYCR
jgi:hypothetical protein